MLLNKLLSTAAVNLYTWKYILDGGKDRSYDVRKAYHKIHQDLCKKYPGHILPANDLEWVFLNSGGWMGAMCLLHASVTEYVLFFGTAIDTSGHSGNTICFVRVDLVQFDFKSYEPFS